MYAFTYHRATGLRHAANLMDKLEEPKILAGGQTLLPTMKQRLASPANLIDLGQVEGMSEITQAAARSRSARWRGITTSHNSPIVQEAIPALAYLAGLIGDPAVRHRGTIGGSVANNDPNADYPAACLGLGCHHRDQQAQDRAPTSSSRACSRPRSSPTRSSPRSRSRLPKKAGYYKFRNQASRFALVGVFVAKRPSEIRVAVTGAGSSGVFRVPSFEEALKKRFSPKSLEGLTIPADWHGKRHPWQRRIPRAPGRRVRAPRGRRGAR